MKIAFIGNFYGQPRGHSYVTREFLKAAQDAGHEVMMFRAGDNPIAEEFPVPEILTSCTGNIIPRQAFEDWLDKHKPDFCMFNEYCQWWDEDHDKVEICNDKGIKTIGWNMWEKLDWNKIEHYKKYWKIICPSGFQTKLMRKHGLYNTVHVIWGVDFEELEKASPILKNKKLRFVHIGGGGGVDKRKNTEKIIKAYEMVKDENTELIITSLWAKTFSRNDILGLIKSADVLVNTSKWDSIGIDTLLANAFGVPALVCDAPPMNEFVLNRVNGFLIKNEITTSPNVTCPSNEVDINDLAKHMNMCKNELILKSLKNNSKKHAEINFNWKKNSQTFLKLLRDVKC